MNTRKEKIGNADLLRCRRSSGLSCHAASRRDRDIRRVATLLMNGLVSNIYFMCTLAAFLRWHVVNYVKDRKETHNILRPFSNLKTRVITLRIIDYSE